MFFYGHAEQQVDQHPARIQVRKKMHMHSSGDSRLEDGLYLTRMDGRMNEG